MLLLSKWNWPVCDVFLDLFLDLLSLFFLLNRGYPFCWSREKRERRTKWNWPVSDVFLDFFSDLLSLVFLLNCGYPFRWSGAKRERGRERERRIKKIILKSKKLFLKGSFIYNIYEILIFRPPSFSSAPIHKYSIRSELTPILDILNYYSIPPVHYG